MRRATPLLLALLCACPGEEAPTPEEPARPGTQLISGEVHVVRASRDGRWAAFFNGGDSRAGDLWLAALDHSRDPERLAQGASLTWTSFSPDGTALAWQVFDGGTESTGSLFARRLPGSTVLLGRRVPLGYWRWLPGSARLLALSEMDRATRLGTLTLHDVGAGTSFAFGPRAPLETHASADGSVVAARHRIDLSSGLGPLTLVRGDAASEVNPSTWWALAVSPDGKKLAWSDSSRALRIRDLEDDAAMGLPAQNAWTARFSPDGKWLGWIDTLGLKSQNVQTGARRSLHDPASRVGLDFTADSRWILFHEAWSDSENLGDLFLAGAAGEGSVAVGQRTFVGSWATAPGSPAVAVSTDVAEVDSTGYYRGALVVAEGPRASVEKVGESVFELGYVWSADGVHLAFVDGFRLDTWRGALKVWSSATREVQEVSAAAAEGRYAFTPAGGLLYVANLDTDPTHATYGLGDLWYRAPEGAQVRLAGEVGDFVVLASGRQALIEVFTGDELSGLWVIDLP